MINFIARICSKRVTELEHVINFQQRQLKIAEEKFNAMAKANRTLNLEKKSYQKLTNKLTAQIIEHQKNVASGKYENRKAKKSNTKKFIDWMTKNYGIAIKDGQLGSFSGDNFTPLNL